MMLARNSLAYIYDEITSRKVYRDIKETYIKAFELLKGTLEGI